MQKVLGIAAVLFAAAFAMGGEDKDKPKVPASIWRDAKFAKLTFVIKKAHTEKVDPADLPTVEGKDFKAAGEKAAGAVLVRPSDGSVGESSVASDGSGELRVTLFLFRDAVDVWPTDGADLKKANMWGREFAADNSVLQFNLIVSGVQDADGVITGKIAGIVLADDTKFSGAEFELKPIRVSKKP